MFYIFSDLLFGLFVLLIVVLILGGALLGWVHWPNLRRLRRQLQAQQQQLEQLRRQVEQLKGEPQSTTAQPDTTSSRPDTTRQPDATTTPAQTSPPPPTPSPHSDWTTEPVSPWLNNNPARTPPIWLTWLREHWMTALGGISLGLAGIFLVHYSIEQGHLGPLGRVLLAILVGLLLHGGAEWLRRRTDTTYPALAALAGGGSLILYAAVLAALRLYALWPPVLAFALLALIALGTMLLALRHGPVLAILGLLGAYTVPMFLGTDSDALGFILIYSLLVTLASLVLLRYVYRHWLWWWTLAGALFWWWAILTANDSSIPLLGLYLAVLAWGLVVLRWPQEATHRATPARFTWLSDWSPSGSGAATLRLALLIVLLALTYTLGQVPALAFTPTLWLPPLLVILWATYRDPQLQALPWLAFGLTGISWLAGHLVTTPELWPALAFTLMTPEPMAPGLQALALWAGLFSFAGILQWRQGQNPHGAASLALLAPILALALMQRLWPEAVDPWLLAGVSVLIGLILGGIAAQRLRQGQADILSFWLIVAAHAAYSLAAVMALEAATLTLALAVQILSLTWLSQYFGFPQIERLIKLILAVIVLRLSLNPWLLHYEPLTPWGLHWTVWTYGGSLILVIMASRMVPLASSLRTWLNLASLHLALLFIHTQIRVVLYAGEVFTPHYDFIEAAISTSLWAAFGLLYYLRRASINHLVLHNLHRILAALLLGLATLQYLILLSLYNPLFHTPSANLLSTSPYTGGILLLAYALPLLLWWLAQHYYVPVLKGFYALLTAIGLWVGVSVMIRHAWQEYLLLDIGVRSGELYSYSAAWLTMAVATLVFASLRGNQAIYRGGLALLGLVILKVFFVDMAELTGLLRAVSFLGLGLALLGVAFIHQHLGRRFT